MGNNRYESRTCLWLCSIFFLCLFCFTLYPSRPFPVSWEAHPLGLHQQCVWVCFFFLCIMASGTGQEFWCAEQNDFEVLFPTCTCTLCQGCPQTLKVTEPVRALPHNPLCLRFQYHSFLFLFRPRSRSWLLPAILLGDFLKLHPHLCTQFFIKVSLNYIIWSWLEWLLGR